MLTSALLAFEFVFFLGIAVAHAQTNDPEAGGDAPFVPGEILVGYHRDQVGASALRSQLGMQTIDTIHACALDGVAASADLDGYVIRVETGAELETIERLLADPSVAFATPNWTVQAAGTAVIESDAQASVETPFSVDDTFYSDQQWYLQRINASRAWQLGISLHDEDNRSIRVAVIDSGVDFNHPELKPHLLPGINYVEPALPPVDDYGHGTHISGVIAATLNNDAGISGLAPWVKIDPYRVLNSVGSGSVTNVANAICDAADNGADIINLSLETTANSDKIRNAVAYAARKNVLLVGAAGNCGNCPVMYPAAYPEVMAVAATNYDDQRAVYSAVGPQVEIAAPGGGLLDTEPRILSTWAEAAILKCASDDFLEQDRSPYCDAVGTSMASSVVSGVAALIWGMDPSLSSDTVRAILNRTATRLPYDATNIGSGRVDAYAAMREMIARDLEPSVQKLNYPLPESQASIPFRATVVVRNPSPRWIEWSAELESESSWLRIVDGPTTGANLIGYGDPGYVTLEFLPNQAGLGSHANSLVLRGWAEGFSILKIVPITLNLYPELPLKYYWPLVSQPESEGEGSGSPLLERPFRWETPDSDDDRVVFVMTDGGSKDVSLPFTFPYGNQRYNSIRLHADGVLTVPSDDLRDLPSTNRCLPESHWPVGAIYGWWADLDPGQSGATVSSFGIGTDRYVFEFANVPSAASVVPGYVVSFQIVLHADGTVDMNYLNLPSQLDLPPRATVGLESVDGRFQNQVFCSDENTTLRIAPDAGQSIRFTQEDIY